MTNKEKAAEIISERIRAAIEGLFRGGVSYLRLDEHVDECTSATLAALTDAGCLSNMIPFTGPTDIDTPSSKALPDNIAISVFKVISAHSEAEVNDVSMISELKTDVGIDSLDIVEITMGLEELYNIEIPDNDTDDWVRVMDIVKYISSKVQA